MKGTRVRLFATCTLLLSGYAAAQAPTKPISVTGADTTAAADAKTSVKQIFTANTPVGIGIKSKTTLTGPPTVPFPRANKRWPGDLSYEGGPTVKEGEFHAVYILNSPIPGAAGCTPATIAACWGNPEGFLKNLGLSDFISITDQYVQRNENNRYTLGGNAEVYFGSSLPHTLTDADVLAVVHLVASVLQYQTGYNGIFHVFLPPGTDECFDSTDSECYSPDKPSTFYFCGYHGSVDFTDIGHVLYSVEPFQDVNGCNVPPGGPQGQLADSTNNVLSHETFETITDPDGNAWWNAADNGLFGEEIGDECSFLVFPTATSVYFNPSVIKMNGVTYAAQPEYSNKGHACMVSAE
ncbi:MAG: hypothetical protein WA354_15490 [Terracidiphilus sp.]